MQQILKTSPTLTEHDYTCNIRFNVCFQTTEANAVVVEYQRTEILSLWLLPKIPLNLEKRICILLRQMTEIQLQHLVENNNKNVM